MKILLPHPVLLVNPSLLSDDVQSGIDEDLGQDCCWKIKTSESWQKIRRGLSFMFTNVGLICFVIFYCIIGALVFEYLEKQNEIEVRVSYRQISI